MHYIDCDRRRKAAVGERQLDAISEMQPPDDLRLAVHQRIFGDVETEGFEPRAGLHQVFDEKPLAGADIEHAVAGLQAEMLDHVLGDREPSPIVAIPAIARVARPVEVFAPYCRAIRIFASLCAPVRFSILRLARG